MRAYSAVASAALFLCLVPASHGQSPRSRFVNEGWAFEGRDIAGREIHQTVTLPHTWNAKDAQAGYHPYRGQGTYTKILKLGENYRGKRLFLRFGAVGTVADVSVNGQHIGQHRGGYSAFAYEITPYVNLGGDTRVTVVADNSPADDILPLVGDFDQFGGIHRPVELIVTNQACITPLDYASPGVYLKQTDVSQDRAEVEILTKISNGYPNNRKLAVRAAVTDAKGNTVAAAGAALEIAPGVTAAATIPVTINQPHLWNGREDPYLYSVRVRLLDGNNIIDEVVQPLGLRFFEVDPDDGLVLNGAHLKLHGVARHEERQDRGSALTFADQLEDFRLIEEIGANAVRLAHYQHAEYTYQLCDRMGFIVWAEIPFVGFPAFLGDSFHATPEFEANGKQQLIELIRQNYNHPSIFFWGIYNEQPNPAGNSPLDYMKQLQKLAEQEDPTRLTTAASMIEPDDPIHDFTDVIAWNRYFGWYYGQPQDLAGFLDKVHKKHPSRSIAISEYGAGASIRQHQAKLERPNPFGAWHPEEWQAYVHERNYRAIEERPFVWGSFVWAMFDFTSSQRREGDAIGINDKGLVTHDRQTRKDAFYYYKARWSGAPVLYLTGRRFKERLASAIDVKVYSNLGQVALIVNGESHGSRSGDHGVYLWRDVPLRTGNNVFTAKAARDGRTYTDSVVWMKGSRVAKIIFAVMSWIVEILIAGAIVLAGLFLLAYRGRRAKWPRRLAKVGFYAGVVLYLALWAGIAFLNSQGFNLLDR